LFFQHPVEGPARIGLDHWSDSLVSGV
jgi:hypothetical protein